MAICEPLYSIFNSVKKVDTCYIKIFSHIKLTVTKYLFNSFLYTGLYKNYSIHILKPKFRFFYRFIENALLYTSIRKI